MIELASPSVEMSFEMRFQSLEVESEDVVCGPTPAATFVRSALPGPGVGTQCVKKIIKVINYI